MLNIEHVKSELGTEVQLADVCELYPEMKKRDVSQSLRNAGWEYKNVWLAGEEKSAKRWCEVRPEDRTERTAKRMGKSSNIYDVMIVAMENDIDPTDILKKLQELEMMKDMAPQTEFQECLTMQRALYKEALEANEGAGPQYALGAKAKKLVRSGIFVFLVENLYPQLTKKDTYKNHVKIMDSVAEEIWDQFLHNHIGNFYAGAHNETLKDAINSIRERYHKKYRTSSLRFPLTEE